MIVKVTKADIRNGCPCSSSDCPIALAIWRQAKKKRIGVVRVRSRVVYINHQQIGLPDSAVHFMRHFDARDPVEPFEFYLDVDLNEI